MSGGAPAPGQTIVRPATAADVAAIRDLFNALIPTTTGAWRDHLADEAEMAAWFTAQGEAGHPVLVADQAGVVVGYTTWSAFRGGPRLPGYRHSAELTIHVAGGRHRSGLGRLLLDALVAEGRRQGIHVLIGAIDAENTGSIAFHEAAGFVEVARMPEVGRKFDRWLDLVLLQRIL